MGNYEESGVTQLNKLKYAGKTKTGIPLRMTKKNLKHEELPHELFLTARQKSKIINAFANDIRRL